MSTSRPAGLSIKPLKRSDLIAQEIKRLITEKNLSPGDRLPRESELQAQFQVSKGTIREALKSLEVQGLLSISTGPSGGGTIVEVPLDRTLQFMQNYLFFQEVTIDNIYGVRQMLEPELAAGAVPHLTEADFHALEHSISCCDPNQSGVELLEQRREDVNFHDILAAANPNPFLRFTCELINEMIRQLIVFGNRTAQAEHRRFGAENAAFHRDILDAARARDSEQVRRLMQEHMHSATRSVQRMKGRLQGRLILDADTLRRASAAPTPSARSAARKSTGAAASMPAKTPAKARGQAPVRTATEPAHIAASPKANAVATARSRSTAAVKPVAAKTAAGAKPRAQKK
ncbi:FCD domain-containing protein [Comamonas terrigena]|uniref:FCD domain-containing protein n=1 Tax=Comamonas terrigena TaxID=32013 RepID=UPI00244A8737|nr:FCD domain-containing protein [Comamonas terrigena]MDH1702403.1 FCD domain-containing protein [Comamonas terrigena]